MNKTYEITFIEDGRYTRRAGLNVLQMFMLRFQLGLSNIEYEVREED